MTQNLSENKQLQLLIACLRDDHRLHEQRSKTLVYSLSELFELQQTVLQNLEEYFISHIEKIFIQKLLHYLTEIIRINLNFNTIATLKQYLKLNENLRKDLEHFMSQSLKTFFQELKYYIHRPSKNIKCIR